MNEDQGYWSRNRISRRTALRGAAIGLAGVSAAALIGCSSDSKSKDSSNTKPVVSGTSTATAASAKPKRGGTLRFSTNDDVDTFDVLVAKSFKTAVPSSFAYSRLTKFEAGDGKAASGAIVGDAAQSWEAAPDNLTYTFKIRPGMKFDQRAPTNGRELTSEDVVQSWKKFAAGSAYRAELVNTATTPTAPVKSVEAIDKYTVQFKLANPDVSFLAVLSHPFNFWVHPVESISGGFDPAKDMRGTGPFVMTDYRPSVGYTYERNPNWYGGPDMPYVDRVEVKIIPDAAQSETQFRAGNLDFGGVSIPNIPSVLKEVKGVKPILANPGSGGIALSFNYKGDIPWRDVRVRRALSMAINRDAFIDVIYGPKDLEQAGVKVNRYWNTPMAAGYGDFWLDPKGSAFGAAAKYLQFNVAEAKAMLAAAGIDSKKKLSATLIFSKQYGADWQTRAELFQTMLAAVDVDLKVYQSDYTTDWVPKYLRAQGNYTAPGGGLGIQMAPHGARTDPGQWLEVFFASYGSNNVTGKEYPELDKLITKQRSEFDRKARISIHHDIQRYMVDNMVAIGAGMAIDTVSVSQGKLNGPDRYQAWGGTYTSSALGTELVPQYWFA